MSEVSKKKVIGITGSMGSGKSQVTRIVSEKYPVIDCDRINADLLEPGHLGYEHLLKEGLVCLDEYRRIDKAKLSISMFQEPAIKQKVESILHPLIFSEMSSWIQNQEGDMVFVEMPILFETHAESYFDSIWCVVCDRSIALQRLCTYRKISNEEANRRLSHQMPVEEKIKKADRVLYNDGTIEQLKKQIEECIEKEKIWN